MRTYVLTLDGVFDLGLAALLDTLSTAHELGQAAREPRAPRRALRPAGGRGATQRVRTLHRPDGAGRAGRALAAARRGAGARRWVKRHPTPLAVARSERPGRSPDAGALLLRRLGRPPGP